MKRHRTYSLKRALGTCRATGKHMYGTRQAAQRAVSRMRARNGDGGLRFYRCKACRRYHIGHPTGSEQ